MLDVAIIGGGPAGLTAGLYTTRGGLKNVTMFEKGLPGGAITASSEVENYPGVCEVKSGMDLMACWPTQCMRFGLKHDMSEVKRVSKNSDGTFKVLLSDGKVIDALSVIVCTGGTPRRAGFEGESEFWGRGISTCATCDGFFYKEKEVAVLGGGDSALEEAIYLSRICSKVYLIHRRDTFKAAPSTIEHALNNEKIVPIYNSTVRRAFGDNSGLAGIEIEDLKSGQRTILNVPGLFLFVGYDINNSILKQEDGTFLCEMTPYGEIRVDLKMRTNIPGLFAAGDVREQASKQVICAAGDGATAALSAIEYVESLKGKK